LDLRGHQALKAVFDSALKLRARSTGTTALRSETMSTSMLTCVEMGPGRPVSARVEKICSPRSDLSLKSDLPPNPEMRRILLLEDDLDTQENLRDILELDGYAVDVAAAMHDAAHRAAWKTYQAIVLDRRLSDGFAEDLLPQVRELAPQAAVILVTGYPDLDSTISALRHGAVDYILKPVNVDALRASLARIAELAAAEERARQAERLAAVGQMVAVVTHEARNALQLTQANLEMLAEEVVGQAEPTRLVNRIQQIQDDLKTLFEDIRSSVAPLVLKPQRSNLAATVRKAHEELQAPTPTKQIELREEFVGDAEPQCDVDAFRIGQVFRNLFENSLAACPAPVVIHVRYENGDFAGRAALRVIVRDNGPVLNAEQKQKIFDPFYTTKHKGTGLGMAIAKRIMEAHDGDISVGTCEQGGAEFVLTLPRLAV
jgi:signal transduction histidine kinase